MITVISSTNRPESMTSLVSSTIYDLLKTRGCEVKLYSLQDLPASFLHSDMYKADDHEMDEIIKEYIQNAEKIIFVIPEYNGSYPGILKLFIDSIHPRYFREKKAGLIGVSDGHSGNLRGQEHLTGVLHYLKMYVHYFQPKLSAIERLLTNHTITDARAVKQLNDFADYMVKF
jgi:chromate reductase